MGLFDFFKMFKPSKIESKYNELMDKVYNPLIQDDDISQLSDEEKVFYVVYYFNAEWQNGGLCQFFVNSSRVAAPFVSEYMGVVGADAHKKLFDEFIQKNNINVTELSFFDIEKIEEFEEKAESYPFDDYDEAYYEMEPLQTYLQKYIREHVVDF